MGLPTRLSGETPLMDIEKKAFCFKCKKIVSQWEIYLKDGKYYKRCKQCGKIYPTKKPNEAS